MLIQLRPLDYTRRALQNFINRHAGERDCVAIDFCPCEREIVGRVVSPAF